MDSSFGPSRGNSGNSKWRRSRKPKLSSTPHPAAPRGLARPRSLGPAGLRLCRIPFAVSQTAQVHHSARGCRACEAALGHASPNFSQPQRGCILAPRTDGLNLFRVHEFMGRFPRVARSSQPWAERRSPVGAGASRTLAALRDTLLPKLLSGELRVKSVQHTL